MQTIITPAMLRKHNACYADDKLNDVLGDGKTPDQILDLNIPDADKIWVFTRAGLILSDRVLRLFACACAENVLSLFEDRFTDEDAPRVAIQIATAYAMGEATRQEVLCARFDAAAAYAAYAAAAAAAAAADAAADAAAAYAAAAAAADAAAYAAADADARNQQRAWQVALLCKMIAE